MIAIDRKIAKTVLKEAGSSYHVTFLFDGFTPSLFIVPYAGSASSEKEIPLPVRAEEIPGSLDRLFRSGHLKKEKGIMHNGCYFTMTPLLLHRFAFWLDAFTKKFWYGFFSGIATAVAGGVILHFILATF